MKAVKSMDGGVVLALKIGVSVSHVIRENALKIPVRVLQRLSPVMC